MKKTESLSDLVQCIESVSPIPPMVELLQNEITTTSNYTIFAPINDANVKEWCTPSGSTNALSSDELNLYLSYWIAMPLVNYKAGLSSLYR